MYIHICADIHIYTHINIDKIHMHTYILYIYILYLYPCVYIYIHMYAPLNGKSGRGTITSVQIQYNTIQNKTKHVLIRLVIKLKLSNVRLL